MRQVESFRRIARRLGWGIAGAVAMALVLTAGGCGDDDNAPANTQCLAQLPVSADECTLMQDFIPCEKRQWSPPNKCRLSSCACPWAITCNYSFTDISESDCEGVWFGLQCLTKVYTALNQKCDLTQCLCFKTPTPAPPTRTPTPTGPRAPTPTSTPAR